MSPRFTVPVGKPAGTNATPYGFTSPFGGTVETGCTCAGKNGVGKPFSCAPVTCAAAATRKNTHATMITLLTTLPKSALL